MTFLFQPPDPENYVGGSWGNLEIAPPTANYTSRVQLRQFDGISDDNALHLSITSTQEINSASVGANGLDAGVLVANKIYYIWVIGDSNGVNPTAGLFSLSYTTPTLPSGYDKKRLVGSITTDASPAFRPIRKVNDLVFLIDPVQYLNVSSAFIEATISIGAYTSQFAKKAFIRSWLRTTNAFDSSIIYAARPTYFAPTYYQYYHAFQVNVDGAEAGWGQDSDSGWLDLEVVGTSDPPTVNLIHILSSTGTAECAAWLVGFQELLP